VVVGRLDEAPGDTVDTSSIAVCQLVEGRGAEVERPVNGTTHTLVGDFDLHRFTLIVGADPAAADGVVVRVGGVTREGIEELMGNGGNEVALFVNSPTGIQTRSVKSAISTILVATCRRVVVLSRGLSRGLRSGLWVVLWVVVLVLHGSFFRRGGLRGRSGLVG